MGRNLYFNYSHSSDSDRRTREVRHNTGKMRFPGETLLSFHKEPPWLARVTAAAYRVNATGGSRHDQGLATRLLEKGVHNERPTKRIRVLDFQREAERWELHKCLSNCFLSCS